MKNKLFLYSTLCLLCNPAAAQEATTRSEMLPTIEVLVNEDLFSSAGTSTLGSENIAQQQADNTGSLLNILPGVSMSGSQRPGAQTLNIWGLGDAEDVKINLDGANKNFEKYRQGSIFIEPELIKYVKVDKGAFDISKGNGGFGGSVTLETKDARDFLQSNQQLGGMLKYSYHTNDNQNIVSGAIFAQNEKQNADVLLYASMRNGKDIKKPSGKRFKYSANDQDTLLLKANVYPTEEQKITISGVYSEHDAWEPWAAQRGEIRPPSQRDIDRYGLDGAWKRRLVKRNQKDQSFSLQYEFVPNDQPLIDLKTTLSYSKTKQHDRRPDNASKYFLGSMGNESWTEYKDIHFDIHNTSQFNTGDVSHNLKIGAQINHSNREILMFDKSKIRRRGYNGGYFQPYYMPSGKQINFAVYAQDEINYKTLTITPGLRYDYVKNEGIENSAAVYNDASVGHDYSKKSYSNISPYLGVYWQPSDSFALFANAAKTWRAPIIDEQYEVQYSRSSVTGTSRNLNPETMTQLRLGSIVNIDEVFNEKDNLQLRATIFHNEGKNEIFKRRGIVCQEQLTTGSSRNCTKPLSNYRNLNGYTIQGVELEAYYQSDYLFGGVTLSAMKGKRKGSPRNPWFQSDTWMRDIPPRKATVTLGTNIPQWDLSMGWKGEFVRKKDRTTVSSDPNSRYWSFPASQGYALHGLFATWKPKSIKGFTLRVTADNIFNKKYQPYLSEGVTGTGRNIKLSLSQSF